MNRTELFRRYFFVGAILLVFSAADFGQPESRATVDASYDVSLQLVIGSNDAVTGAALPGELNAVTKQIRSSFSFANYRLASTFLGRIANSGNFEYKSTSNIFGQELKSDAQPFLEWSIVSLKNMPTAKGSSGFAAQSFKFGARVPVASSTVSDGKTFPVTSYEAIGLGLSRVGLAENTPTLVGTLNLPGAGGTIFLVMTVRSAD